eukprot:g43214.t1
MFTFSAKDLEWGGLAVFRKRRLPSKLTKWAIMSGKSSVYKILLQTVKSKSREEKSKSTTSPQLSSRFLADASTRDLDRTMSLLRDLSRRDILQQCFPPREEDDVKEHVQLFQSMKDKLDEHVQLFQSMKDKLDEHVQLFQSMKDKLDEHVQLFQSMKDKLDAIAENTACINELCRQMQVEVKNRDFMQEVDQVHRRTCEIARAAREELRSLKSANEKYAQEQTHRSAIIQIRANILSTYVVKLKKVLAAYEAAIEKFHKESKQRAQRELKIVSPDWSDEKIIKFALQEVEQRHNRIKRLERSVAEVLELLRDLDYLIEEHHTSFDSIEVTLARAKAHVDKAEDTLRKADKSQRKAGPADACL